MLLPTFFFLKSECDTSSNNIFSEHLWIFFSQKHSVNQRCLKAFMSFLLLCPLFCHFWGHGLVLGSVYHGHKSAHWFYFPALLLCYWTFGSHFHRQSFLLHPECFSTHCIVISSETGPCIFTSLHTSQPGVPPDGLSAFYRGECPLENKSVSCKSALEAGNV